MTKVRTPTSLINERLTIRAVAAAIKPNASGKSRRVTIRFEMKREEISAAYEARVQTPALSTRFRSGTFGFASRFCSSIVKRQIERTVLLRTLQMRLDRLAEIRRPAIGDEADDTEPCKLNGTRLPRL